MVKSITGVDAGIENVYDLEIEDQHEYFANGILVHNCDAMRYGIYSRIFKPKKTYADANY